LASKTLFSQVHEELDMEEGKSPFFYRRAMRRLITRYKQDPSKIILDEKRDTGDADENTLRVIPKPGHIMMFDYMPEKDKNVKYFDSFPLVYIVSISGDSFLGSDLRRIDPMRRQKVIDALSDDRLMLPRSTLSKYLIKNVKGFFLDIAHDEWESASLLPLENFVSIKDGKQESVKTTDVWKNTRSSFGKMLRGRRIYKSYGKNDESFRG